MNKTKKKYLHPEGLEIETCKQCPYFQTCDYVQVEKDHWQDEVADGCPYCEALITNIKRKGCYCYTCRKEFHHYGIAGHRAMHKRRREACVITYSAGITIKHQYRSKKNKIKECKKAEVKK